MGGPIRHIAVVGGGLAAWTTASALARRLPRTRVTIVDAAVTRPAIGDQFATMQPGATAFHRRLGIDVARMIDQTNGVFRLGFRFEGWRRDGTAFTIGHGGIGTAIGSAAMHQLWARAAREQADCPAFDSLVPAAALAGDGRFAIPAGDRGSPMAEFDSGFAMEAATYAGYLRAFARHVGVVQAQACTAMTTRGDRIDQLTLADGSALVAELYVDATGPDAMLLSRLPGGSERINWRQWLPVDRIRIDAAAADPALPASDTVVAESNGWRFISPLRGQTLVARGYESRILRDAAGSTALSLAPGRRERAWIGNCVAIGDAAVEVAPIAAPHLFLVQAAADRIVALLPDTNFAPAEVAHYNCEWREEVDRLRDFLIAAYRVSSRAEPFWRRARATPPPPALAERLGVFGARGRLLPRDREVYDDDHWLGLLLGAGLLPERTDTMADIVPRARFDRVAADRLDAIANAVAAAPTHAQALAQLRRERTA